MDLTNCEVDTSSFTALSTTLYTVVVSPLAEGTVQVALAATATTDLSSNQLVANSVTFVYDVTSPTPTITTTAGTYSRVDPIPFTVTFQANGVDETVTGFIATDITVTNGAVTASSFSGSGASYTFTVTPVAEGGVIVRVRISTCPLLKFRNSDIIEISIS